MILRVARVNDPSENMRIEVEAGQTRVWTELPCVVDSVDKLYGLNGQPAQMTLDLQPTINGIFTDELGVEHPIQMPVLLDCPVIFISGGGATVTVPVAVGNEVLVLIASRCIDAWWSQGWQPGSASAPNPAMNPPELRMHNLSDGFALPGVKSQPNAFTPDQQNLSIQSNDGQAYIRLNPTSKSVAARAPGGINLNGVTIDSNGNLTSPATIQGAVVRQGSGSSSVTLGTHDHSGVTTGSGNSAGPVPGT